MNSALESIRGIDHVEDLLSRLRLDGAVRNSGACVVEGEVDARVYDNLLGDREVTFFPIDGRNNVLRCAEKLREMYLEGVICIADRDFDDCAVERADDLFLVFTDNADLEAMLFHSPALERFLLEWASDSKMQQLGGCEPLRSIITDALEPVSRLRRGNSLKRAGLSFDDLDLTAVFNKDDLALNQVGLVARLARVSNCTAPEIERLLTESPIPVCADTGARLVRGKDCLAVLSVALRRLIANCSSHEATPQLLERALRLAVKTAKGVGGDFVSRFDLALTLARP